MFMVPPHPSPVRYLQVPTSTVRGHLLAIPRNIHARCFSLFLEKFMVCRGPATACHISLISRRCCLRAAHIYNLVPGIGLSYGTSDGALPSSSHRTFGNACVTDADLLAPPRSDHQHYARDAHCRLFPFDRDTRYLVPLPLLRFDVRTVGRIRLAFYLLLSDLTRRHAVFFGPVDSAPVRQHGTDLNTRRSPLYLFDCFPFPASAHCRCRLPPTLLTPACSPGGIALQYGSCRRCAVCTPAASRRFPSGETASAGTTPPACYALRHRWRRCPCKRYTG